MRICNQRCVANCRPEMVCGFRALQASFPRERLEFGPWPRNNEHHSSMSNVPPGGAGMFRHFLLSSLVALLPAPLPAVAQAPRLPNVVFIFTDDQGYGDVGCYGAKGFQTPNLDRMAAEGIRFTDFYVAQAVCSASRTALLTGCYPNRLGILGALNPTSKNGISDQEKTIADLLKT